MEKSSNMENFWTEMSLKFLLMIIFMCIIGNKLTFECLDKKENSN